MTKYYDMAKFRVYPWWKKGKRADDYFQVCYTEKIEDIYRYGDKLRKEGVKVARGKWHATVVFHQDKKDKHLKGYALFCKKSITDPSKVAHEVVHLCQMYFGYLIWPLCMSLIGQNHELFAHSHTFMMDAILKWARKNV